MTNNILAVAQRESAGASTFGKYNFQYHWALCKIIEKHQKNEEYALLIEYHEDVVIADNLDGTKANFEFYQVKNQAATFTANSLTKRLKGTKKSLKSSVLGKLLSSCVNTPYEKRISNIGLVSSSGFSLEINGELVLDIISTGDLTANCLQTLTTKIDDELGIKLLPNNLKFIVPEIQLNNQEDYVLAQFAKLVHTIFSGAQCSAVDIYRAVIDEMGRKGRIQLDYKDWDRLIDKKSLTSDEINNVLAINSTHPKLSQIETDFNALVSDMGWRPLTTRALRNMLSSLVLRRSGFSTSLDLDVIKSVNASIAKVNYDSFASDSLYVNALMQQAKMDELDKKITNPDELKVEIFYSILAN